jgi:hypothetical protein
MALHRRLFSRSLPVPSEDDNQWLAQDLTPALDVMANYGMVEEARALVKAFESGIPLRFEVAAMHARQVDEDRRWGRAHERNFDELLRDLENDRDEKDALTKFFDAVACVEPAPSALKAALDLVSAVSLCLTNPSTRAGRWEGECVFVLRAEIEGLGKVLASAELRPQVNRVNASKKRDGGAHAQLIAAWRSSGQEIDPFAEDHGIDADGEQPTRGDVRQRNGKPYRVETIKKILRRTARSDRCVR